MPNTPARWLRQARRVAFAIAITSPLLNEQERLAAIDRHHADTSLATAPPARLASPTGPTPS